MDLSELRAQGGASRLPDTRGGFAVGQVAEAGAPRSKVGFDIWTEPPGLESPPEITSGGGHAAQHRRGGTPRGPGREAAKRVLSPSLWAVKGPSRAAPRCDNKNVNKEGRTRWVTPPGHLLADPPRSPVFLPSATRGRQDPSPTQSLWKLPRNKLEAPEAGPLGRLRWQQPRESPIAHSGSEQVRAGQSRPGGVRTPARLV